MGAKGYFYFTNYQRNILDALQELREREFMAGRYSPAADDLEFPIVPESPAPGAAHESIEDALNDSGEEGTCSILDLHTIADKPDLYTAGRLSDERLSALYGTTQPTREMVERNMDFFRDIDRGEGLYIVIYKDGVPDGLFFAGYSFD